MHPEVLVHLQWADGGEWAFFVAHLLYAFEIPCRKKAREITLLTWPIAPVGHTLPMRPIPDSKVLGKKI